MFDYLFLISFVLFVCCIIGGGVIEYNYYNYLKCNHRDVWHRLGQPEYFNNLSIKIKDQVKNFEKNKEYLILKDKKIENIIKFKKFIEILCGFILLFYLFNIIIRTYCGELTSPFTK